MSPERPAKNMSFISESLGVSTVVQIRTDAELKLEIEMDDGVVTSSRTFLVKERTYNQWFFDRYETRLASVLVHYAAHLMRIAQKYRKAIRNEK
jgi:hypothetical protein